MKRHFDQDEAPPERCGPVVALGIFDGVHVGHRRLLSRLVDEARRLSAPALAVTFSPHPRLALGRAAPPAITSLDNRLNLLDAAGLDAVWTLSFTPGLSRLSAKEFAEEYFFRRLRARKVILGESARFGRGRDGGAASLGEWGSSRGVDVEAVPPATVNGRVVSSTAIRLAVAAGDLGAAAAMLGRPPSVIGTVVRGRGIGRRIGFPTLNMDPHHELRPPPGVYVTKTVVNGREWDSVTNIGRPPSDQEIAAGIGDLLVESHLFDSTADMYGETAEAFFLRRLRDVRRFDLQADLEAQIRRDAESARARLAELARSGPAAENGP